MSHFIEKICITSFTNVQIVIHIFFKLVNIIIGDEMNIDLRKYIINNFKDDNVNDIEESINMSIDSKEEDPLIGMGVLFELAWINSTKELREEILNNIKKGITSNV